MATLNQQSKVLQSIDPSRSFAQAQLGALVETNSAIYFLALGLDKVTLGKQIYFVISPHSPIGKVLLQKEAGASISFRNQRLLIRQIS